MIRQVQATHVGNFADIVEGQHVIVVTVGSDLSPVVLTMQQTPDYRKVASSGASFAKKRAGRPNEFSIRYLAGTDWQRVDLEETHENFHFVQPLDREHWLLVRGRADGKADPNATVFDMNGRKQRSFHVGDGIQDVQVSEDNEIWISYFDEGVFGDTELGKAGLACLDPLGNVRLLYNEQSDETNLPFIADCYALNVCSSKEVWLYYYTDFPLVRLLNRKVDRIWRDLPVHGSNSFAVGHNRVVFCGSYDKRNRLFLVDLNSMSIEEIEIVDVLGHPIEDFRGIGRRSVLYLWTSEGLYRLDINEL